MPPETEEKKIESEPQAKEPSPEAKELAELKAQLAKEKEEFTKKERKQLEEAQKQGELQKALEIAHAQLAEFDEVKPLAERWRQFEKKELKRLEEEAQALPEQVRGLFAKQSTLEDKQEFIRAFNSLNSNQNSQDKKPKAPPSGQPNQADKIDFQAVLQDSTGKLAAEAKAKDPEGFKAFMVGVIRGTNTTAKPRFS